MNFLAISGLINCISNILLGFFVLLKGHKRVLNRTYFNLSLSIALFNFGYFFWQLAQNQDTALFWFRVLTVGIILINLTYLHFVFSFLEILDRKKKIFIAIFTINFIFLLLNASSMLYKTVVPKYTYGYWPIPTYFFHLYLTFWFGQCIYAFYLCISSLKTLAGLRKQQLKYFIFAGVIGFFGGATNWPLWYNIPFPPYLNILITLAILIIAYAIVKYRLMDIRVAITRAVIFLFVHSIAFGVPGITLGVGRVLFSDLLGDKWWLVPLGLFIGMISTAPYVYFRLRQKAEDWIYRDQREYEKVFREVPKRWIEITDPSNLFSMITDLISRYMRVNHSSLFVYDEDKGELVLKARSGGEGASIPNRLELNNPLVYWFITERDRLVRKGIFKLEDVELLLNSDLDYWLRNETLLLKDKGLRKLLEGMRKKQDELKAVVCMPCYYKKGLVALITLGRKVSGKMYNEMDLDILSNLASEVALVVKNSQLVETMMQQKVLANLGQMSIYIAHDLNSPLSNVKTFHFLLLEQLRKIMQKAPPKVFRYHDMIENEIERMGDLIKDLLLYTRPTKPVLESIYINGLIDGVVEEMNTHLDKKKIQVTRKYSKDLSPVRADRSQMTRVFVNLIDNAIYAMDEQGQLRIKTEEDEDSIKIVISDNGKGIASHILPNVFKPFVTFGKKGGSGLGLAIVDQFVRAHKGDIGVESKEGEGTTFTVKFPLEKREFARLEKMVKLQRITSDEVLSTKNISNEGICFSINESIPVGEYLRILIALPTLTSPFEAVVKVAWLRESLGKDSLYDIGVEIVDIKEEDNTKLLSYIRGRKE